MKKLFQKNLILISSVLLAILLRFAVTDNENPIKSLELNVPLKIHHENTLEEKGLLLKTSNLPKNVSVTIKGRKDKIEATNPGDIEAFVDFSKIKDDFSSNVIYVSVNVNKIGVAYEGVTPGAVKVEIEKAKTKMFPVYIVPMGTLDKNYKIVNMTTIPKTVSLNNIGSANSIGSIKVFVDVNNLNNDISVNKKCLIYNRQGLEMKNLSTELDLSVNVKIDVAKEVVISPFIIGKPASNYVESSRLVTPEKVLITGHPEILNKIYELRTSVIDIQNQAKHVIKDCKIDLPQGVSLVNSSVAAYVNVFIEPLETKEFIYKKDEISVINKLSNSPFRFDIIDDSISIKIKGISKNLKGITKKQLNPRVNVTELNKKGKSSATLNFDLPGLVDLEEEYKVLIDVREKN